MNTSDTVKIPESRIESERSLDKEELIHKLAADLKAKSDPDLPHSFYVAQVRRQLTGRNKISNPVAANDRPQKPKPFTADGAASVFQYWAMPEK